MSSLALKLRNTLESLKRNASAPDKWAQVCPLLKSRKDTEFLSNSLILTLLKLVERDLTSANRDSYVDEKGFTEMTEIDFLGKQSNPVQTVSPRRAL